MDSHKLCKYRLYIILMFFCAILLCGSCSNGNQESPLTDGSPAEAAAGGVNINTASPEELEKLPNIGPKLAQDIVEYRTEHGPFRRVEHLLLVNGISEARFREIRRFVTAGER